MSVRAPETMVISSSKCGRYQNGWREKQNMVLVWKNGNDIDELTSFVTTCSLRCAQRVCKPNATITEQYTKIFELRNMWSCDMDGHAQTCLERYRELKNQVEQFFRVSHPLFGCPSIQSGGIGISCQKFTRKLF